MLELVYGAESAEAAGFLEIAGEGAEARGWGLPLAPDNQWGMQRRLERAEGVPAVSRRRNAARGASRRP